MFLYSIQINNALNVTNRHLMPAILWTNFVRCVSTTSCCRVLAETTY